MDDIWVWIAWAAVFVCSFGVGLASQKIREAKEKKHALLMAELDKEAREWRPFPDPHFPWPWLTNVKTVWGRKPKAKRRSPSVMGYGSGRA